MSKKQYNYTINEDIYNQVLECIDSNQNKNEFMEKIISDFLVDIQFDNQQSTKSKKRINFYYEEMLEKYLKTVVNLSKTYNKKSEIVEAALIKYLEKQNKE